MGMESFKYLTLDRRLVRNKQFNIDLFAISDSDDDEGFISRVNSNENLASGECKSLEAPRSGGRARRLSPCMRRSQRKSNPFPKETSPIHEKIRAFESKTVAVGQQVAKPPTISISTVSAGKLEDKIDEDVSRWYKELGLYDTQNLQFVSTLHVLRQPGLKHFAK